MNAQRLSFKTVTFHEWTILINSTENDPAPESYNTMTPGQTVETRTALKSCATSLTDLPKPIQWDNLSGSSFSCPFAAIQDASCGRISLSRIHLPDGGWVQLRQNEAFVKAFQETVKGSEFWQRRLAIEKLRHHYKVLVSELLC